VLVVAAVLSLGATIGDLALIRGRGPYFASFGGSYDWQLVPTRVLSDVRYGPGGRFEHEPLYDKCPRGLGKCAYGAGTDTCFVADADVEICWAVDCPYNNYRCPPVEARTLPGTDMMIVSRHSQWPQLVVDNALGDAVPSEAKVRGGPRLWLAIATLGLLAMAVGQILRFRRSTSKETPAPAESPYRTGRHDAGSGWPLDVLTMRYITLVLISMCAPSALAFLSWAIQVVRGVR
jgi:hypothetical protein